MTSPRAVFHQILLDHQALLPVVERELASAVVDAANLLRTTFRTGGKILICGNGGSAADAQHFAAELIGRFDKTQPALAAMSLAADSSTLSALGNDLGFEQVFSRQVEALGKSGDLLVAITTSGASPNVVQAAQTARGKGLHVLTLSGQNPTGILADADVLISIPSSNTQRFQEMHELCLHAICEILESQNETESTGSHE